MMKTKAIWGCLGILAVTTGMVSCSSDDDDNNDDSVQVSGYVWSTDGGVTACDHLLFTDGEEDPDGTEIGNGDKEFVFTGNQTLAKGTYTLKGWVYIADGAELTIPAGTVIKGDKTTMAALIVERGGKIHATGTATQPIVFTSAQAAGSRRPGDWGGLIICGNATNNQTEMQIEGGPRTKHGGTNDSDNSGELQYVRIEFAGYPFEKDKEINGLTMGSVGSGTTIDHVQVSYCNDDSYEWFGGAVNAKYLIAYKGWDDEFDTDNGFSGNVQFCLSIRDSKIADTSQSNGFESDNNASGSSATPYTTATFSNVTFIGPKMVDSSFENTTDYITGGGMNPNNGSALGRFQSAMQIRRASRLNCYNSIAVGYPIGLIIDGEKGDTPSAAANGELNLKNILFAGMDVIGSDANKQYSDVLITYDASGNQVIDETQQSYSHTFFELAANNNKAYDNMSDLMLNANNHYMPQSGSPVLSYGFTNPGSAFDQVTFVGAFDSSNDWTSGWANWDPQNTSY